MHSFVSTHLGVKGNMNLGPSDKNGMLGDKEPFKVHSSELHVFGHVARMKVTIIAWQLCVHVYL
jgi:hypothetical protein